METTAAGAAVLEIERFEWAAPDRIEIAGYWSGLRGRRFVRPTLVLKGEEEQRRLLAVLDHKPWAADDGVEWIAAFAWDGPVEKFDSADLHVGAGIDLTLPPPRMRPGKPRRFRQRVTANDAAQEDGDAKPRPSGIVSDAPAKPRPKRATTKPPAAADPPGEKRPAAGKAPAAEDPGPAKASAADGAGADLDTIRDELEAARADVDRLRGDRDALRRERDSALERLRRIRAELEQERQSRERAVADARAAERESANTMLAQGAELRATIERQREIAYLERNDAKAERDEAVKARDTACEERDGAFAEAKHARRERKEAFAQRDRAVRLRERAEAEREKAVAERDAAIAERDKALEERDEVVSVHERGLPVHPPKPRFLPEDHEERSDFDLWAPRAVAIGLLVFFAFFVLRMFAGL